MKVQQTNTTRFILPCFGVQLEEYRKLGFINSFLSDVNDPHIYNDNIPIYLLFKPSIKQLPLLQEKIDQLEEQDENKNIILNDYDYDGNFVIIVLKLPERFKNDFKLFLEGKYSHLSKEIQKYYPVEVATTLDEDFIPGKSLQWLACNRSSKLKTWVEKKYGLDLKDSLEYWSKPGSEEKLDLESIIQKEKEII